MTKNSSKEGRDENGQQEWIVRFRVRVSDVVGRRAFASAGDLRRSYPDFAEGTGQTE